MNRVERLVDLHVDVDIYNTPSRKLLSGNDFMQWTKRSTETAYSTTVSLLEAEVGTGRFAIGTFIGIEGSFEITYQKRLLNRR